MQDTLGCVELLMEFVWDELRKLFIDGNCLAPESWGKERVSIDSEMGNIEDPDQIAAQIHCHTSASVGRLTKEIQQI